MRWQWLAAPAAMAFVSLLTACTVSVPTGITGAVVSFLSALAILASGATSSGCDCGYQSHGDDDDGPGYCLSIAPEEDAAVWACLDAPYDLDADVGPCLEAPYDPDAHVGPCLGAPWDPDAGVGPCLDAPADPDAGPEPSLDGGAQPDAGGGDFASERARATDRLADRLPADVVARLRARS